MGRKEPMEAMTLPSDKKNRQPEENERRSVKTQKKKN